MIRSWRWLCGGVLSVLASPALSAVLLVDTSRDEAGAAFQVCDADPGNGNCSLRGALLRANTESGPHTVQFRLPVSDAGYQPATAHWRIQTGSDLPAISADLTIDGYSQPGALANTFSTDQGGSNAVLKIELRSGASGQGNGLFVIGGPGLAVRGLAINGYQRNVLLFSAGTHRVQGCFIGTDITGLETPPGAMSHAGIVLAGNVQIGGVDPASRNVIAGARQAIQDFNQPAVASIQGNLIGLNAAGDAAMPGQEVGIYLSQRSQGSVIGGVAPAARNVISGFRFQAIYVFSTGMQASLPPVRVIGNDIGTDVSGVLPIGNGLAGTPGQGDAQVLVYGLGDCRTQIGGVLPGEGNRLAFGHGPGITVAGCRGAPVLGNRFRRHRGLPLDLAISLADGATPNDPDDADGAPGSQAGNRLQNAPDLLALEPVDATTWRLTYRVDTAPAHADWPLRIAIERGVGGEPAALIAVDSYAVSDAQLPRSILLPASALAGGALVLSATDAAGNSSEFGSDALLFADFE